MRLSRGAYLRQNILEYSCASSCRSRDMNSAQVSKESLQSIEKESSACAVSHSPLPKSLLHQRTLKQFLFTPLVSVDSPSARSDSSIDQLSSPKVSNECPSPVSFVIPIGNDLDQTLVAPDQSPIHTHRRRHSSKAKLGKAVSSPAANTPSLEDFFTRCQRPKRGADELEESSAPVKRFMTAETRDPSFDLPPIPPPEKLAEVSATPLFTADPSNMDQVLLEIGKVTAKLDNINAEIKEVREETKQDLKALNERFTSLQEQAVVKAEHLTQSPTWGS